MAKKHTQRLFKRKRTIGQKILGFVRGFDFYGKNIVLTYKGDDKYRTHIGGIASVVVGGIVLAYILLLVKVMIEKGNTSYVKSSLLNDILTNSEVHYPAQNDYEPDTGRSQFDFAFQFTSDGVDYLNDPTAFTFEMNLVEQEWVTESGIPKTKRNYTSIDVEKCGDTNLNYDDLTEIKRLGIDNYYCPIQSNFSVAGSFFSPKYHYIEMKLRRCVSGGSVTCKSTTDLESLIKDSRFSLAIVNTVVDLKNYKEPLQYIIDDGFYWELTPNIRKKTDIFIRKNEATFQDDYIQLGFPDEREFYQVATSQDRFEAESSKGDVLSIYWRFDKTSDVYERRIYSIGDLLGQAGGFYGSFIGIGSIFLFIFSERLFVASILRKIYQIDTWQERERLDPTLRKNHKNYHKNRQAIYHTDGRKKKEPYTESEKFHVETLRDIKNFNDLKEDQRSKSNKTDILDKCEESMRERRVLRYGYSDILHYIFCCVICRRKKSMRLLPRFREHLYYEIGQEKLLEELDCVTIIKSVRQLKLLTLVLLTKSQKFMMKFQRNNVIDSSSSGTSDEGQMNIISLMEKSQNIQHSKLVDKKINKAITRFKNKKLQEVDQRIVSGIVKKRFSDSDIDDGESDSLCNIGSDMLSEESKEVSSDPKRLNTGVPLIGKNDSIDQNSIHMPQLIDGEVGITKKLRQMSALQSNNISAPFSLFPHDQEIQANRKKKKYKNSSTNS
ncbi:unnamed protein product [Moneuplotes crassus]|uniref:Uncharacterized protein n=1 Tax=Euplotes crassus TaxID=5936 RepID=A0AAD2DCL3_EUPCR|nr:unnamed protein product [Moneuplotes crassus]